jgi:hypothetical protein
VLLHTRPCQLSGPGHRPLATREIAISGYPPVCSFDLTARPQYQKHAVQYSARDSAAQRQLRNASYSSVGSDFIASLTPRHGLEFDEARLQFSAGVFRRRKNSLQRLRDNRFEAKPRQSLRLSLSTLHPLLKTAQRATPEKCKSRSSGQAPVPGTSIPAMLRSGHRQWKVKP